MWRTIWAERSTSGKLTLGVAVAVTIYGIAIEGLGWDAWPLRLGLAAGLVVLAFGWSVLVIHLSHRKADSKARIRELVEQQVASAPAAAKVGGFPRMTWELVVRPILDRVQQGTAVRLDVMYDVALEATDDPSLFEVFSTYTWKMRLDTALDELWVSFARSADALAAEYGAPGCLARELTGVPQTSWERLCRDLRVTLKITGHRVDGAPELDPMGFSPEPDIVRWRFSLRDPLPAGEWLDFALSSRFLQPSQPPFFVMFTGDYLVARMFRASFTVPECFRLAHVDYLSHGDKYEPGTWAVFSRPNSLLIQAREDCLIWPGSGVLFFWEPA